MSDTPSAELAARCCITCGEIEGTPWVTTRCQFEIHEPAPAYEPVVQEFPHGFYGGTRRVNAKRATEVCRHQHKSREAAQKCADRLTTRRNAAVRA